MQIILFQIIPIDVTSLFCISCVYGVLPEMLTLIYVFLVLFTICHFDIEKSSKKCKYSIFFYQKFVHLGDNTYIYCSLLIVVHVHATVVFSKVHPVCHNIANGFKPGNNSK